MDAVEFHREPPSNIPTMVVAFGGWIDAGEAVTGAMRYLVRQLAAAPLASMDPEDFFDFTQVRPVVRLTAEGERTIRWPRSAFWTWQPPEGRAGLLLFRGMEPQRRWRTYATALLDVAARCGVQRIVSLGALVAAVPHTRPPRVTGSSTDPAWHARLEAWGMLSSPALRRPDRHCQRRVGRGEAPRHGVALLDGASTPLSGGGDESGGEPGVADVCHPPVRPGTGYVPLREAVQAFGTRCDQAVAHDAATQAYVRQLEQDYDTTGDEAPRPLRDEEINSEQLMHELEDFLRKEREG